MGGCKNCRPLTRDKRSEDGFCPLCGKALKAFKIDWQMRGWCMTKDCPNYEMTKPEGIEWWRFPNG